MSKEIEYCQINEVSILRDGSYGLSITNIKYKDMTTDVTTMTREEKVQAVLATKIICFQDRVLVLPDNEETRTPGGIIIPDTAKEKPRKGTVLAVGADVCGTSWEADRNKRGVPKAEVGGRIIYGKYAGTEVKINGIEVILMRESDILMGFPGDMDAYIEM